MILEEAIKNMETIAEGNQLAIDTGVMFNDAPIDMFFCDNNEVKNKCLANYQRRAAEHRQLAEWLKELKQLREQARWIPVSERLPKDKTYVLTTIKIPNRIAHARSGWYKDGLFHNDNGDTWGATDIEVLAWMPLPQPYKVESEE